MNTEPISVSFCISDNFSQHLAVVVASLLQNTPRRNFIFNVLTKAISEENVRRLRAMEGERCTFRFHHVDRSRFDAFPLPLEHVTQEMYYRFLLPEVLEDEKRTIYIDVDVIARGDVTPIWEAELGGNPIGCVPDVKPMTKNWIAFRERLGLRPESSYFLSGMMVMDLERLREEKFCEQCMKNTGLYHDRLAWPDQDIINITMEGRIQELPQRFNCCFPNLILPGEQILIRHFANFSAKPWCCLWKNKTWPEYLHYLRETPYRDKAAAFVWAHIKGFFFFRYEKKGIRRVLICGIPVAKCHVHPKAPLAERDGKGTK